MDSHICTQSKLVNCNVQFNSTAHWTNPIDTKKHHVSAISSDMISLFDQNGYDLTELEKLYSLYNNDPFLPHRQHRFSIKRPWYVQIPVNELGQRTMNEITCGAVLNHCYLFERKGYSGAALDQLKSWTKINPLFYKIINIRPKWGIDFSMDYVDHDGNVFEIFHYEYDTFSFEESTKAKEKLESIIESIDWNAAAKDLLDRKEEWGNLSFFEQSDWKCKYFGLPSEKFKEVTWKVL